MAAESRSDVHKGCLNNPLGALEKAFSVTSDSDAADVEEVFVGCAARTGALRTTAIAEAKAFINTRVVPLYVLQCCSAKLSQQVDA